MSSLAEFVAPLAMALPVAWSGALSVDQNVPPAPEMARVGEVSHSTKPSEPLIPVSAPSSTETSSFEAFVDSLVFRQMRIEQRVIIRIAPRRVSERRNMLAQLPVRAPVTRYEETDSTRCVEIQQIAGVETGSGNRLLLFMRDADILSLNLEKACRARDFYSGFYVEPNEDGKLCISRDILKSRNGARCNIKRMMELEELDD